MMGEQRLVAGTAESSHHRSISRRQREVPGKGEGF